MPEGLPNLEKFGVLARKYLHDTSNDLTAIGLRLTFLEKSLAPDHPAYGDLQKLALSCQGLLGHTRELIAWRNQWPEVYVLQPLSDFINDLVVPVGWEVHTAMDPNLGGHLKFEPRWFLSLQKNFTRGKKGALIVSHTDDPTGNTITTEQVVLTYQRADGIEAPLIDPFNVVLVRELARLMGGSIELLHEKGATLRLPLFR